jgi:hypothetical protein
MKKNIRKIMAKKKVEKDRIKLRAKRLPTFVPQDDPDNIESLNNGYMAETAPYGYYRTNKK